MLSSAGNLDFNSLNTTLIFLPDITRLACAIVEIQDDDILESSEDFFVVLSSNDPGVDVVPSTATVLIVDDDCKCGCMW